MGQGVLGRTLPLPKIEGYKGANFRGVKKRILSLTSFYCASLHLYTPLFLQWESNTTGCKASSQTSFLKATSLQRASPQKSPFKRLPAREPPFQELSSKNLPSKSLPKRSPPTKKSLFNKNPSKSFPQREPSSKELFILFKAISLQKA